MCSELIERLVRQEDFKTALDVCQRVGEDARPVNRARGFAALRNGSLIEARDCLKKCLEDVRRSLFSLFSIKNVDLFSFSGVFRATCLQIVNCYKNRYYVLKKCSRGPKVICPISLKLKCGFVHDKAMHNLLNHL